jgi:DNA-binding HxlR family transcriptional regulator
MVCERALEEANILTRKVVPRYPLHVKYAVTERGKALGKVILAIDDWGELAEEHQAHEQVRFRRCAEHE